LFSDVGLFNDPPGVFSMQLSKDTQEKLKRYFLNASPFLWGLLKATRKKDRVSELKALGFLRQSPTGPNQVYDRINQELLIIPGIEGILEQIVAPRVWASFPPEILRYFRRCWEQGQTPPISYLKEQRLYRRHPLGNEVYEGWPIRPPEGYRDPAFIFFGINTQYNFIERWTVFAGLWFEEIEPLLGTANGA
jgi:hypothetical protein